MTDCMFCRIVARESPADIEYEDDAVLAFKDIYPKAAVHMLIVPKHHFPPGHPSAARPSFHSFYAVPESCS